MFQKGLKSFTERMQYLTVPSSPLATHFPLPQQMTCSRWRCLGVLSFGEGNGSGTQYPPPPPLSVTEQKQVTSQSDALLLLLLTDNMWLREELLKSIWHAFTALDVDHRGKVSKSQLKVRARTVSLSPVTASCPMETILFQTELKVHLQGRDDCSGSSEDRGAADIFCQM